MQILEFVILAIMAVFIGVLTFISIKYINKYNKLVDSLDTIYDVIPKDKTPQARAMQLSNELDKYICTDEDNKHIYLTVVDPDKY